MSESYVMTEVQQKQLLLRQMQEQFDRERESQRAQLAQIMRSVAAANEAIKRANESGIATSSVTTTRLAGIEDHAPISQTVTGFDDSFMSEPKSLEHDSNQPVVSIKAIDFSKTTGKKILTESEKKENFAKSVLSQLSVAVPLNADDALLMGKFNAYVQNLLDDPSLEAETFIQMVGERWGDLLPHVEFLDPANDPTIEEYYTLCSLAGEKSQMLKRESRKREIQRLRRKYEKQFERDYVYQNLVEVFEELGMHIGDELVLEGIDGRQLFDDEISNCSVFMSSDGDGILFEPIVETGADGSMSQDERYRAEESALKLCAKQEEVRRLMAERGILIHVYSEEKPSVERMKKVKRSASKRKSEMKQAAMNMGD